MSMRTISRRGFGGLAAGAVFAPAIVRAQSRKLSVVVSAVSELQLAPLLDLEIDDPAGAELALALLTGALELAARA